MPAASSLDALPHLEGWPASPSLSADHRRFTALFIRGDVALFELRERKNDDTKRQLYGNRVKDVYWRERGFADLHTPGARMETDRARRTTRYLLHLETPRFH
jgi:hypothetical protein